MATRKNKPVGRIEMTPENERILEIIEDGMGRFVNKSLKTLEKKRAADLADYDLDEVKIMRWLDDRLTDGLTELLEEGDVEFVKPSPKAGGR